jgi:hypothetical protein
VRQASGSEHIEPHDRPAEGAKLVVDVEPHAAITSTTLGRSGPVGVASFRPAAIQNDLDGGIAREGAFEITIEILPITRDHEYLLGDRLRAFLPALGVGMKLGQQTERPLIKESRQWNPRIPAARGARGRSDVKACLTIEAESQAAKR